MTKDNKGRTPGKDATLKTIGSRNLSEVDPLIGWLSLGKPSRDRQRKRGWQKGDTAMRSQIKNAITALAVWGVIPAGFASWLIKRGGLKDA